MCVVKLALVVNYIAVVKSWHEGWGWGGTQTGQNPWHISPVIGREEAIILFIIFCSPVCKKDMGGPPVEECPQSCLLVREQIKHAKLMLNSESSHAEGYDSNQCTTRCDYCTFLLLSWMNHWEQWRYSRSDCTNLRFKTTHVLLSQRIHFKPFIFLTDALYQNSDLFHSFSLCCKAGVQRAKCS